MSEENPFDDLEDGDLDPNEEVDDDVDRLFTEVQVEAVDDEAVWDALTTRENPAGAVDENGSDGPGGDVVDVPAPEIEDDDGEGTVVPKGSYCQKCEHFSAPPQVACDNAGTDILELVDVDHFRVRDCPVVERRRSATRDLSDEG